MTVTVEFSPEKEEALKAHAEARGLSVEQWLQQLAERAASESLPAWKRFDNFSDLLLNSPFAGSELNLERLPDPPRPVDIE